MNKIILSLVILSTVAIAGEQQGTGEPSNNAATSNETIYQLVCIPVAERNEIQSCVFVEVESND